MGSQHVRKKCCGAAPHKGTSDVVAATRTWLGSVALPALATVAAVMTVMYLTPRLVSMVRAAQTQTQTRPAALRLTSQHSFKIAVFTDLHFGEVENGFGIKQDVDSRRAMAAILDTEPGIDLVVVNGDLISGWDTFRENSSDYVDQVVAPMVQREVPWASTYGNHESEFNLSREAVFAAETKPRHAHLCHTARQPADVADGITNYFLPIFGRKGGGGGGGDGTEGGRLRAVLWFFDSRGGNKYQETADTDLPNWVSPLTAQWFLETHAGLQAAAAAAAAGHPAGRPAATIPSLGFVHIPPHPMLTAQRTMMDPRRLPGLNEDVPIAIQGDEDALQDQPFVDALRQAGRQGLHSIYLGHDHGNDWCTPWPRPEDGPIMCFAKHTGYGGYGSWNRGARIIQLSFGEGEAEDDGGMEVETWIRMEDGRVVMRVGLNETYGVDEYPSETGGGHR